MTPNMIPNLKSNTHPFISFKGIVTPIQPPYKGKFIESIMVHFEGMVAIYNATNRLIIAKLQQAKSMKAPVEVTINNIDGNIIGVQLDEHILK